jgi:hypothetical protein
MYDQNPIVLASLVDQDYKSFQLVRQTWEDVYNDFEFKYNCPGEGYEPIIINFRNESSIQMAGGIINKKSFDWSYLSNAQVVSQRIAEITQRESFPRIQISCEIDKKLFNAKRGDLIHLVNTEYDVSGAFRIKSFDVGNIDDLTMKINLEQAFEDLYDGNYQSIDQPSGVVPSISEKPTGTVVTFPAYSFTSNLVPFSIPDTSLYRVEWTEGQENSGTLLWVTEIHMDACSNRIVLTNGYTGTVDWTPTVQANALGLLSVTIYEIG